MGKGFWILTWDKFGAGLVMINPKLLTDGSLDLYGNPTNWFAYNSYQEREALIEKLTVDCKYFKIIE